MSLSKKMGKSGEKADLEDKDYKITLGLIEL